MGNNSIVFDDWGTVLKQTVAPELQQEYREAIGKFRYWLKQTGKTPNVKTFKEHLEWKKSYLSPEKYEIRLKALRWDYKKGLNRMNEKQPMPIRQRQPSSVKEQHFVHGYRIYHMSDVPTAGARDW
jgi:hypothetical protein